MARKLTNCDQVSVKVYYDDRDPSNKGWYAQYSREDADGYWDVIDDSQKAGHAVMPKRRDANKKAGIIARAHARELIRQCRAR